jgi:hypothetical protein
MLTATLFFKFEVDPGPGDEFMPNKDQRLAIVERMLKEHPTWVYTYDEEAGYSLIIDSITAEFDIDAE